MWLSIGWQARMDQGIGPLRAGRPTPTPAAFDGAGRGKGWWPDGRGTAHGAAGNAPPGTGAKPGGRRIQVGGARFVAGSHGQRRRRFCGPAPRTWRRSVWLSNVWHLA